MGGDLAGAGDAHRAGQDPVRRWRLARARAAADQRHCLGLVSEQPKDNLLTRHVELEVLPPLALDTELPAETLAAPVGNGGPGPDAWTR